MDDKKASAKKGRKVLYFIILGIAVVVLLISIFAISNYYTESDEEEQTYDELSAFADAGESDGNDGSGDYSAEDIVGNEKEIEFQTGYFLDETYFYDVGVNDYYDILADRDVSKMREQYPDIGGWIYIPGTKISYPLMFSDGEHYLYRNYKDEEVSSGSILCFDTSSFDPHDDNVIIHGHNMKSGMMFGSLKAFWLHEEMWTGNNIIYIDLEDGTHKYRMFSIYIDNTVENELPTRFATSREKVEYLNSVKAKSKYPVDISFSKNDSIITLSTCTGLENSGDDDRLLIQAVLLD